jgi:hypothetical protein
MSARVFVHPRCLMGPALGALQAGLETRGFDMHTLVIGPQLPGHTACELVRYKHEIDGMTTFERLDGTTFEYREKKPAAQLGPKEYA